LEYTVWLTNRSLNFDLGRLKELHKIDLAFEFNDHRVL